MTRLLKSIPTYLLFAAAFALSSCSPQKQDDCGFVQNVYGQRISWKSKKPVLLFLHSSLPVELRPAVYRAAATWEIQAGRKVFEISEDSSKLNAGPGRDQKNAIYFHPKWESDRSSEQGRTSVYWAGDEIQEADIRINAADFSYYDKNPTVLIGSFARVTKPEAVSTGYSFESLLLHEMGHFLGLKHREDSGTVMATHLAAFENRTQLAASDQKSASCEYK